MSIQLQHISKYYEQHKAVHDVSFSIEKGDIVGFLGPNGAGKSTTLKILTGYIKPSSGTLTINTIDVLKEPHEAQKHIGYLPEHNPLYNDMYVKEYLFFHASIHKVSRDKIKTTIKRVGLQNESHKKIRELSKGYRQRVGLAAAILHDPDILILDEPTTGLDPNQLIDIRRLIKTLGKDKIVLLSTHILSEVEAMCNRAIIINKGEIVADRQLSELKNKETQVINVVFNVNIDGKKLQQLPSITDISKGAQNAWTLVFSSDQDMRPVLFDFAQDHGFKILELTSEHDTLERLFKDVTT